MRNRWILTMVAAMLFVAVAPIALGSPGHGRWQRSGTVVAADAGLFGTSPCSSFNDQTTTVYNLPSWAPGHDFYVLVYPTLDVDIVFYDGCNRLGTGGGCCGFLGATEAGTVPSGADKLVIDHWAGAGRFQTNVGDFG